jgi:hypothetical protein
MVRLGLTALVALVLAGPGAWAEPVESDRAVVALATETPGGEAEVKPAEKPRRRLSTIERWRGKPYLRAEDSLLRGQALDKAITPIQNGLATNGTFGF